MYIRLNIKKVSFSILVMYKINQLKNKNLYSEWIDTASLIHTRVTAALRNLKQMISKEAQWKIIEIYLVQKPIFKGFLHKFSLLRVPARVEMFWESSR